MDITRLLFRLFFITLVVSSIAHADLVEDLRRLVGRLPALGRVEGPVALEDRVLIDEYRNVLGMWRDLTEKSQIDGKPFPVKELELALTLFRACELPHYPRGFPPLLQGTPYLTRSAGYLDSHREEFPEGSQAYEIIEALAGIESQIGKLLLWYGRQAPLDNHFDNKQLKLYPVLTLNVCSGCASGGCLRAVQPMLELYERELKAQGLSQVVSTASIGCLGRCANRMVLQIRPGPFVEGEAIYDSLQTVAPRLLVDHMEPSKVPSLVANLKASLIATGYLSANVCRAPFVEMGGDVDSLKGISLK